MFYNPTTKKAVVSYRGTDMQDRLGILGDVQSDYHILTGMEKRDPDSEWQQNSSEQQRKSTRRKGILLITGHSLSGALATYVEGHFPKRVDENLSYSVI